MKRMMLAFILALFALSALSSCNPLDDIKKEAENEIKKEAEKVEKEAG